MPVEIMKQRDLPRGHVAFRLNAEDTKFLLGRMQKAIEMGTGVSFVLKQMPARVVLARTREHGLEFAVHLYSDDISRKAIGEMKGYDGRWSHVNSYMPAIPAYPVLQRFLIETNHLLADQGEKPEMIAHGLKE